MRYYWEFQLFPTGRGCPIFRRGEEPEELGNQGGNFYIFRPDCPHGWEEREDRACSVTVFHFAEVSETLSRVFYQKMARGVVLSGEELNEIDQMAREIEDEVIRPLALSPLRYQFCLDKLSLIFLEKLICFEDISYPSREKQIVDAAIGWYCSHMSESPGVRETAEKMGYNVSHLRRLFHEVYNRSPAEIFVQERMNRAAEMLKSGTDSVIQIALACGYSSHSVFSRAFGNHYGTSPVDFRKKKKTAE
jgi:AraC-like DNA-binding protein